MHPRDMDTWVLLDIQDEMARKTDAGLAAAHEEHRKRMGG